MLSMKIPKNMTEDEVMHTINVVVDRIAPRYTFSGYDVNDIKQESFMICVDALDRYDQVRPLENFLSVNLSNRLKNFMRDNHFVGDDPEKKKVLSPKTLSYEEPVMANNSISTDERIDAREMCEIIDKYLPAQHRSTYLKIISNTYVPKKKKEEVINIIKDLLKGNGYEEG